MPFGSKVGRGVSVCVRVGFADPEPFYKRQKPFYQGVQTHTEERKPELNLLNRTLNGLSLIRLPNVWVRRIEGRVRLFRPPYVQCSLVSFPWF
jgi:hypothetical protein